MDRNFARALSLVLTSEGGWSDNPADPGGATMRGITLATFRANIKPGGSKADLRDITDDQLSKCYRKEYWDAVSGDQLPDGVDYATFDFAVNSGPSRATRYLQSVAGAPMVGTIGPVTLTAIAAKPSSVVIDHLCDSRLAFLRSLPTWGTFGKGWSARVEAVRSAALLMTAMQQNQQASAQPATGPEVAIPNNSPSTPIPMPVPQVYVPPVAAPAPQRSSKPAAAVGLFAIIGTAIAMRWHELAAWIHSFF